MKKIKTIYFLLPFILLTNCQKKFRVNDDFRNNVLSKIEIQEDTLKAFNILLDKLDEKNVAYGEYVKKSYYEIEDSCKKEMVKKYKIDPVYDELTKEMLVYLNETTASANEKYYKKLNIHTDTINIGTYVTASNPEIKKYLNKNYGLEMYIPEN
jgi:predicted RNA-binding protein YlxR (DUF448 family)